MFCFVFLVGEEKSIGVSLTGVCDRESDVMCGYLYGKSNMKNEQVSFALDY